MEFQFGASSGNYQRNQDMQQVWDDFSTWVGQLPFKYTQFPVRAYANDIDGVAATDLLVPGHPEYRNSEVGRIVVDLPQFEPLGLQNRNLTLLHECCHLSSFVGGLRRTYDAKLAVIVRHGVAPSAQPTLDAFGLSKSLTARALADQLLEFDAERILRRDYDWHQAIRAEYFLEMRRAAIAAQRWLRVRESLRPYRLLLEWLRLALGEWMSTTQRTPTELQGLRCQVENELAGYPDAAVRVARLQNALQPASLRDGFEATAHDIYNDVVDDIMAVQAN